MDTIKAIGGEFGLIDRFAAIAPSQSPDLIQGIGDDAAVLRLSGDDETYTLVTTDMLLEDRHFKCQWASSEEIGIKAVECNASDIAAMGGEPTWMFVSVALSESTDLQWAEGLYRGLSSACRRHGIVLAGGDTTRGSCVVISITLMGRADKESLCLRRFAGPGQRIAVTGSLGASAAALALLEHNLPASDYLLSKHKTPVCRLDVSGRIAASADAMIDISDGLAADIGHICSQSGVGADIVADSIPLHPDVVEAAKTLQRDPLDFALHGGEDFELLFTISPENLEVLTQAGLILFDIGVVTQCKGKVELIRDTGERSILSGGFDHFA